ncbi:MAG: glycosyltransferase, partial [Albimonas sp.]|uniref:glycosyltransferase n=1 Tax=Albimonas sp. TaxID=1872425 RepID=UPI0040564B06
WSTSMIMAYLPYLAFEREAWKRFRGELTAGAFDIVHRITPMTPTLPSWIAGRGKAAFVIGPLNGNLAWPAFFAEEQAREREGLRRLRDLYKVLPYARSTYRKADAVLAAFRHTVDDLDAADPAKIVIFPEVGYDEEIFHPGDRATADPADPDAGRTRFLFVGRMVPYKMPEVLVRAMAASPTLQRHLLHFVGDGPETPRLKALVEAHGLQDCVRFEGRRTQAEVADWMRRADVFAFPSIRELGAGVVVEAMACGMINLVVDYGAPGALVRDDRGLRVPLGPMEALVEGFRTGMERCVAMPPEERAAMRAAACAYAEAKLRWPAKAEATMEVYRAVLSGAPMPDVYGAGAD